MFTDANRQPPTGNTNARRFFILTADTKQPFPVLVPQRQRSRRPLQPKRKADEAADYWRNFRNNNNSINRKLPTFTQ